MGHLTRLWPFPKSFIGGSGRDSRQFSGDVMAMPESNDPLDGPDREMVRNAMSDTRA